MGTQTRGAGRHHAGAAHGIGGVEMPDGFLSKTSAEVALDLVKSYLEFADDKEKSKYKQAEDYFALYEKAFSIIIKAEESRGPKGKAGF
jgi:hypothetical protein